jgi:23S rRNA (uracil-5-)-methyltransferase RumA
MSNTFKTRIKKWGINGEGISFIERKPVFIAGAMPGELVEAELVDEQEKYSRAELVSVLEPSARRRDSICANAKACGGCALNHVVYKEQTKMKEQLLAEALKKYAGYTKPLEPIVKNPNPLGYRNALKMPLKNYDGTITSGMYEKNSQNFVPIPRCAIHTKAMERARQDIAAILDKYVDHPRDQGSVLEYHYLIMREFHGKIQVTLVTDNIDIPQEIIDEIAALNGVTSIYQSIRTGNEREPEIFGELLKHLYGEKYLELDCDGYKMKILPRSFYQLNTDQAVHLYKMVADMIKPNKTVVEAYSGIGAMSLFIADKAKKVIGIENVPDAVINANENAVANNKDNVSFICADAGSELANLSQSMKIDTLIVDPPRKGLDQTMRDAILDSNIQDVIYVSCNPATLGKDLEELKKAYWINKVIPVDMFSQTPNVEAIVSLSRKKPRAQGPKNEGSGFKKHSGYNRKPFKRS